MNTAANAILLAVRAARCGEGWGRGKTAVFLILAGLLWGCSDEIHQSFTPGRDVEIGDVLADTAGVARHPSFAGFDPTVSARWRPLLAPVAAAAATPGVVPESSTGHDFFLQLAGALLSEKMPHEQVQPFVTDVARLAWPEDYERHAEATRLAGDTARKHAAGGRVTGAPRFRASYPVAANALRLAMSGKLGEAGLGDQGVYDVLDLCLECRACKSECPVGVDVRLPGGQEDQGRSAPNAAGTGRPGLSRAEVRTTRADSSRPGAVHQPRDTQR